MFVPLVLLEDDTLSRLAMEERISFSAKIDEVGRAVTRDRKEGTRRR